MENTHEESTGIIKFKTGDEVGKMVDGSVKIREFINF